MASFGFGLLVFHKMTLKVLKPAPKKSNWKYSEAIKGLFIRRWAGPVRRLVLLVEIIFYPTFIWILLSQFNQNVCYVAEKRLFDQVVFTTRTNSDINTSYRTNVLILFNRQLKNKAKLIKVARVVNLKSVFTY